MKNLIFSMLTGAALTALQANAQVAPTGEISDWFRVFDAAGNIVSEVVAYEANELPTIIYQVPEIPGLGLTLANLQGPQPTMLYEAGGNPSTGPWSDIFGVSGGKLAFSSDQEGVSWPWGNPTPSIYVAEETGQPVDATMYLNPMLIQRGWTAQFWSDSESVPDLAATAGLLGFAMAGLAMSRRFIRG